MNALLLVFAALNVGDFDSRGHDETLYNEIASARISAVVGGTGHLSLLSNDLDEVAKQGASLLPAVVRIMKSPKCSFDMFTRCRGLCERILQKSNPKRELLWYGGAKISSSFTNFHFKPSGQLDVDRFKQEVLRDVIQAGKRDLGIDLMALESPPNCQNMEM